VTLAPQQPVSPDAPLDAPENSRVATHADAALLPHLLGWGRQLDRRYLSHPGWPRIIRNASIGFIIQAGTRMAAALSYYALFVAGPTLVLTIALGSSFFGEGETRQIVAQALRRLLPPSAAAASTLAEQAIQTSAPATTLALVTGCFALIGFTRALTTSLNVMFNQAGSEPIRRTVWIAPVLYVTIVGLLWGSWLLTLLARFVQEAAPGGPLPHADMLVRTVAPLLLAWVHLSIILRIVPRAKLRTIEILVPAAIGAVFWEGARHLFGWMIGTDSFYIHLFGSLGGVVALLGWIYLSSAILVLTGQIAWAFAMERRGRGDLARKSPREAGLDRSVDPFGRDNAVNEASAAS
jgi:membrane protein